MTYETLIVEQTGAVALIRLNRPKALNALNAELLGELACALAGFDKDDTVGCIVLTGSERAFAAGADIKEMADKSDAEADKMDLVAAAGVFGNLPSGRAGPDGGHAALDDLAGGHSRAAFCRGADRQAG